MIENENLKRGKYLLINIVRRWKKNTIKKTLWIACLILAIQIGEGKLKKVLKIWND